MNYIYLLIILIVFLISFINYYSYSSKNDSTNSETFKTESDTYYIQIDKLLLEIDRLYKIKCEDKYRLYIEQDICYCNTLAHLYLLQATTGKKIDIKKRELYVPEIRYLPLTDINKIIRDI